MRYKKLIITVILLIFFLAQTACYSSNIMAPINSIGNTINGGAFFEYQGVLYGRLGSNSSGSGFFYLAKEENGVISSLFEGSDVSNVVVYLDFVYFRLSSNHSLFYSAPMTGHINEGAIYRIKIDGSELECVINEATSCFYIYKNKIVYQVGNEKRSSEKIELITEIKKAELDGSSVKLVYQSTNQESRTYGLFSIINDKIFLFTDAAEIIECDYITSETSLYQFEDAQIQPSISRIFELVPVDDKNLLIRGGPYLDGKYQSYLYLYKIEENLIQQISDKSVYKFTYEADKVYCCTDLGIESVSILDNEWSLLSSEHSNHLEIINDRLYYFIFHNHGSIAEFRSLSISEQAQTQGDGSPLQNPTLAPKK